MTAATAGGMLSGFCSACGVGVSIKTAIVTQSANSLACNPGSSNRTPPGCVEAIGSGIPLLQAGFFLAILAAGLCADWVAMWSGNTTALQPLNGQYHVLPSVPAQKAQGGAFRCAQFAAARW